MIVDAGVSGFSLERVPITIRQLYWHSSCSWLSNCCCSFCSILLLGCKDLGFAESFVKVALLAGETKCLTAVCQNPETKCDQQSNWGGSCFKKNYSVLSSIRQC
jgi:hypothetical protein